MILRRRNRQYMRDGVLLLDYMEKRGDVVQVGVLNAAAI